MGRSNYDPVLNLKFFLIVSSTTPPTPLHASSCSCRNLRGQWGLSFWGWLVGWVVDRSVGRPISHSVNRSVDRSVGKAHVGARSQVQVAFLSAIGGLKLNHKLSTTSLLRPRVSSRPLRCVVSLMKRYTALLQALFRKPCPRSKKSA